MIAHPPRKSVPERRTGQGEDVGISPMRHTCGFTRNHARRLNPFARGLLIWPYANFLLRQCCAPLRSSRSGHVSCLLTGTFRGESRSAARLSDIFVDAGALPALGRHNPGADVGGVSRRRLPHRVPREMGVPRGRIHHPVAEQVADHRQGLAQRDGAGRERMSAVVDPHAVELGQRPRLLSSPWS